MPHAHGSAAGFAPLTLMWFGMMAAMMAPTVWPWVRSFGRFGDNRSGLAGMAATGTFAGGYLAAWLAYSVVAALAQQALEGAGALDPLSGTTAAAGAVVFVVAGVYQFAPLKRACLTHCRTPITYFLSRWRAGVTGAFRMGFGHGVYCVGCCWALMATALAVGVMNLWWMAALAGLALVEQVAPYGQRLRVPLGVGLLGAGLWRLAAAAGLA
jgi:predicted metal-binding membrane protein